MPTTKHRVNLSVPALLSKTLRELAERDSLSVASKTLELVQKALEIEEDAELLRIAKLRHRKGEKYVSHEKAWL